MGTISYWIDEISTGSLFLALNINRNRPSCLSQFGLNYIQRKEIRKRKSSVNVTWTRVWAVGDPSESLTDSVGQIGQHIMYPTIYR